MCENAKFSRMVVLVGVCAFFSCGICDGAVVTIPASSDTYVDGFDVLGIYGGENRLAVGARVVGDVKSWCRSYLKFDLSSIPSGSVINSAVMELECVFQDLESGPLKLSVHNVHDVTWSESTFCWKISPNLNPELFNAMATDSSVVSGLGPVHWNVTKDVAVAFNSTVLYSVLVRQSSDQWDAGGGRYVRFRSRETTSPGLLSVEYSAPNLQSSNPGYGGELKALEIRYTEDEHDTTGLIKGESNDKGDPSRAIFLSGPTDYSYTEKVEVKVIGYIGDKPCDIASSDGNQPAKKTGDFGYDSLGRFVSGWSSPQGSSDDGVGIKLKYDSPGNLIAADVNYVDGSKLSWSLGYDANDNVFKRVYENADYSGAIPSLGGRVDYFLRDVNPRQLLYRTVQGASHATMLYDYDAADRLISIMLGDGSYVREYGYYDGGWLTEYSNHEDSDYNGALEYLYDDVTGHVGKIRSMSNYTDAEHVLLGQLSIGYYENGTVREVGYSTDEDTSVDPEPLFEASYAYDGSDRLVRAEYVSEDPEVPGIVLVMDPDAESGDYMVTHYIHDNSGRLAWTVDSRGNVTRTIYNQDSSIAGKEMAAIGMKGSEEPDITWFEHLATNEVVRSTDLRGRFIQHEYDEVGSAFDSFVLGVHGDGDYGNPFVMASYGRMTPPDPCMRYKWDQYGNPVIVLDEGEVGINGGTAVRVKCTLSRNRDVEIHRAGCKRAVVGDCDGNCKIDAVDFALLGANWLIDESDGIH